MIYTSRPAAEPGTPQIESQMGFQLRYGTVVRSGRVARAFAWCLALVALVVVGPTPASADSTKATLGVSATVVANCAVRAGASSNAAEAVTLRCTKGSPQPLVSATARATATPPMAATSPAGTDGRPTAGAGSAEIFGARVPSPGTSATFGLPARPASAMDGDAGTVKVTLNF